MPDTKSGHIYRRGFTPGKRPKLSIQEVMDLIQSGVIEVNLLTAEVTKNGRVLKPTIVGRNDKNGTRYRIEICHNGGKRTILRNRLVYMAELGRVIPDDLFIHHVNEDRYDDRAANLIGLSEHDHKKLHAAGVEETPF